MSVSNKIANEKLRNEWLEKIINYFTEQNEDVRKYKSNEICIPVVDCNDVEKWVCFVVKVPTGADKGREPFDGYAESENYQHELKEKEMKRKKKEEEKQKKIAKDKERREKEKSE